MVVIVIDVPQTPNQPLTLGEALEKLFLANADRGANAANDELIRTLRERARASQALVDRRC
jgi:hypothetical protein